MGRGKFSDSLQEKLGGENKRRSDVDGDKEKKKTLTL